VQVFRNTVPESLEFAKRFHAGELTTADEVAWVNAMARPQIELRPGGGGAGQPVVVDPEITNLLVTRGDGRLLLAYEVRCSHRVAPGERVGGFDTFIIPSPSLPSEDDQLELFDNGLYYRGVLYPGSSLTFVWSERRRRPAR
jgi:hypothetical protein